MNVKGNIKRYHLIGELLNGRIGLERESLRATVQAQLALTAHPAVLGDRTIHPYIQTDYSESQPEVITPPLQPYYLSYEWLRALSHVLLHSLEKEEYLWPFSVPCQLPPDEQILLSTFTSQAEKEYRTQIANKYGKKRQLLTGVHINYSFSDKLVQQLFLIQTDFKTEQEFRDELYLILASNFSHYQWLLTYLFGATPMAEDSFFDAKFFEDRKKPLRPMRSLRNSSYGFSNRPGIVVRYDKVENYVQDIRQAVRLGLLLQEREFYGNIRLRGKEKATNSLLQDGVQYLEIRSFDIDPFTYVGLSEGMFHFVHLFLLTLACLPKATNSEVLKGNQNAEYVAGESPYERTDLFEEGKWLLDQMQLLVDQFALPENYNQVVQFAREWLGNPEKTVSARVMRTIEAQGSFLEVGESLGQLHKAERKRDATLPGFHHVDKKVQDELFVLFQKGKIVHQEQLVDQ